MQRGGGPTGTTALKLRLHTAPLASPSRRGYCSITYLRNPTLTVGTKRNHTAPTIWRGQGIIQKNILERKRTDLLIGSVTVSLPCLDYTVTALLSKAEGNASGPIVCVRVRWGESTSLWEPFRVCVICYFLPDSTKRVRQEFRQKRLNKAKGDTERFKEDRRIRHQRGSHWNVLLMLRKQSSQSLTHVSAREDQIIYLGRLKRPSSEL